MQPHSLLQVEQISCLYSNGLLYLPLSFNDLRKEESLRWKEFEERDAASFDGQLGRRRAKWAALLTDPETQAI